MSLLELDANVARFFFEAADFPSDAFQVTRFTGVEGISQPYRFTIDLVSQDPSIDFERVVLQRATFTMMRGTTPVRIHGQIADFSQLGRVQNHAAYRAVLVPRLGWLRHQFQSHIHQRLAIEAIITQVFREHDVRDVRFDLQGTYDPIEYCVQYNETDLAFIRRLMEREGVFFYFEQDDEKETLVITDHQGNLQPIDGDSRISYREEEGRVTAESETVQRFICRERAGWPGRVRMKDYRYETPNELLFPSEMREGGYGNHYEYGEDHLTTPDQGDERTRRRLQALAGTRHAFRGKSNCMGLRSGYQYSLAGHFRPDFNADYLLVKVKHRGSQENALGMAMNDPEQTEQEAFYENKFLCRRADVPYRPLRRTPVPKVPGLMIAHIDHPDRSDPDDHGHLDAYAHLDSHGRYKATVNFDADRPQPPADHSLPLHIAQHYAGPNYGTHFPLHGGVEVLLACVNGDPNRPVIVGTRPNPNHTSPVTAANVTQNIIRTFAGNEMLMEDEEGITKISLTTPGGHNETLDDGERRIIMTSAGGHIAKLDDANQTITAKTTNDHHLVMSDEDQKITLRTTGGHTMVMNDSDGGDLGTSISLITTDEHILSLSDTHQVVGLSTKNGHYLEMHDAEETIKLLSVNQHGLGISDADNTVALVLDEGEGHMVELTDGSTGNHIQLLTVSEQKVLLDDDGDAIEIDSPDGEVVITAGAAIRLEVGSNSVVIDSTGVSINGTLVTIN